MAKKGVRRAQKNVVDTELTQEERTIETADFRRTTSQAIASLMQDVAAKEGSTLAGTVPDAWKMTVCLPFPSFSLEYLFDLNGLPLEKVIGIKGLPKVKKSGFAFEIFRWIRAFHGVGTLIEHESKFHSTWASSIIGYEDSGSLGFISANSVDHWQSIVQTATTYMQKRMRGTKEKPGLGTGFPYYMLVDSIMGKSTLETQHKVEKMGSLTRNWPAEALTIRNFMMAFPQKLVDWPFLLVFINHLKPQTNDKGITIDGTPGGLQPLFQVSFDIKMRKVRDIHRARLDGTSLMLDMVFSSYGQDRRKIPVDCIWDVEDKPDPISGTPYRQRTVWDWNRSTVELMLKTLSDDARAKEACKIIGLQLATGNRCSAPGLKVPRTAPISFTAMGRLIQRSQETINSWRKIFGIKQCKLFQTRVPYSTQKKAAAISHIDASYLPTETTQELEDEF